MKFLKWAAAVVIVVTLVITAFILKLEDEFTSPPRLVQLGLITNENRTNAVFKFELDGGWRLFFKYNSATNELSETAIVSAITNIGSGYAVFSTPPPDDIAVLRPNEGCVYPDGRFKQMFTSGSPVIAARHKPTKILWRLDLSTNIPLTEPIHVFLREQTIAQ